MSEDTFFDRLERKIQEQYLALKLEKQMSKSEIMENYLNTINLGQKYARRTGSIPEVFQQGRSQLTLSESAVIAAITQSPSYYNPITHPDHNADRRKQVLKNMLEQGYISQEPMTRRWPMMSMPASRMSIRTSRRTRLLRATS